MRIGSVPYLNACVLVHGLRDREGIELEFDPPSLLAKKLAAGQLDVALASSIEYLRHPEYAAIPGLSISGLHEMWSIRFFHRTPLTQLRSVVLDPASETTNSLLKILLGRHADVHPEYHLPERDQSIADRAESADAFLLIGDPALGYCNKAWSVWDLQAAWHTMTGLPFVYALWLARPGVDVQQLGVTLRQCRDAGLAHAAAIASREAPSRGLSAERAHEYITRVVRYMLAEDELSGLRRFQEFLDQDGVNIVQRDDYSSLIETER